MTWHVATVSSRKEASAVHDLTTIGIEAYYPIKVRWRQISNRKVHHASPIIPGYVFFKLNEPDEQRYIDTCDGVTGVLTMGFTPEGDRKLAGIGGGWVESIRDQERRGEFDSTIDRSTKAKPGDRVRIIVGDFAERIAIIQRAANKREWTVEVETTGSLWTRTTISKDGVRPLEEAA
jgi:transcription antitermination factor NusG